MTEEKAPLSAGDIQIIGSKGRRVVAKRGDGAIFVSEDTDRAGQQVFRNVTGCQLDRYLLQYSRDVSADVAEHRRRGVTTWQHAAGVIYRETWRRATQSVGVKIGQLSSAGGGGQGPGGAINEAMIKLRRMQTFVERGEYGRRGIEVLNDVAVHDHGVSEVDKSHGWPKGMAAVILRAALDRLCDYIGSTR